MSANAKRRLRREAASAADVGVLLGEIATRDYGTLRALARAWGLSVAYVAEVVRGTRAPGPAILDRIGIERVVRVTYRPLALGGGVGKVVGR